MFWKRFHQGFLTKGTKMSWVILTNRFECVFLRHLGKYFSYMHLHRQTCITLKKRLNFLELRNVLQVAKFYCT